MYKKIALLGITLLLNLDALACTEIQAKEVTTSFYKVVGNFNYGVPEKEEIEAIKPYISLDLLGELNQLRTREDALINHDKKTGQPIWGSGDGVFLTSAIEHFSKFSILKYDSQKNQIETQLDLDSNKYIDRAIVKIEDNHCVISDILFTNDAPAISATLAIKQHLNALQNTYSQ